MAPTQGPPREGLFSAVKQETATRSWTDSDDVLSVSNRAAEVLRREGGRVTTGSAGVEATFGSWWAMRLGGLAFARRQLPFTVRIELSSAGSLGTAVMASAVDTVGGPIRLSALGKQCQRRFTELFDALQE